MYAETKLNLKKNTFNTCAVPFYVILTSRLLAVLCPKSLSTVNVTIMTAEHIS